MPIWMVARNWLGSRASLARVRPRRPPVSSRRLTWLSRSVTRASSVPVRAAFSATSTRTRTSCGPLPFTGPRLGRGPGHLSDGVVGALVHDDVGDRPGRGDVVVQVGAVDPVVDGPGELGDGVGLEVDPAPVEGGRVVGGRR